MQKIIFHRLIALIAVIATLLTCGTCGYMIVEGWPLLDGFYMTLITLSTVGYGETQELSHYGRIFTSLLILVSMFCMAFWTAGITSIIVSFDVSGAFQKQKEMKMISQMSDHTIVCGGGSMARTIIDQLVRNDKPVVAIIEDPTEQHLIQRLYPDLPIVKDDPKSEFALADANAISAKNLVAALESDFDNLLITITGKGMGTELRVISFAQSTDLASRMKKVGAHEVICPFILGGEKAAQLIA